MLPIARSDLRIPGGRCKRQRRIRLAHRDPDDRSPPSAAIATQLSGDASNGRSVGMPSERRAFGRSNSSPSTRNGSTRGASAQPSKPDSGERPNDGAGCQQPIEVCAPSLAAPEQHAQSQSAPLPRSRSTAIRRAKRAGCRRRRARGRSATGGTQKFWEDAGGVCPSRPEVVFTWIPLGVVMGLCIALLTERCQ